MHKNQKWALILFSVGVFMAALDNGIISAALTTLIYSFDVSPTWGSWSITIYTLGLGISVPIIGKLSDRFGRKKLFLVEVFLFGLGSLLVALSQLFPLFLVSRFIQAIGGGGIFIIASSYVLSTFPREKQGRALGMLGGMNGIAAILGPNIGSFILQITGSWHWLFLINLPIAVILIILGKMMINEVKEETGTTLDWSGAFLLMFAVLSFMYGLTNLEGTRVWESMIQPEFYGFVAVGLVLLVILWRVEQRVDRKGRDPILPVNLLRHRAFRWTLFIGFLSGAILSSVIFIPAYVEQFLGVPADKSGYWFTPLALASGIGAGGGGAMVDRKGPVFTLLVAAVLCVLGFMLFPLWVETTWQMVIASSLVGIGFGMMMGAPVNYLAGESADGQEGTALGTLSLFRQLAMTVAPTLYAGFIARAYMRLGERVKEELANVGISGDQIPVAEMERLQGTSDIPSLIAEVNEIPVPQVRDAILTAIHESARQGFDHLYTASMVISLITLLSVVFLAKVRKNREETGELNE